MARVASEEETGVRFSRQLPSYSMVHHAIFISYTTKKDTPLLTREKSKRINWCNCFLLPSKFGVKPQLEKMEHHINLPRQKIWTRMTTMQDWVSRLYPETHVFDCCDARWQMVGGTSPPHRPHQTEEGHTKELVEGASSRHHGGKRC